MTFGMGNGFCNECCWLLVTGNQQTRLQKKSGVILIFK
jgi:RNase P subunit RPR2